MFTGRIFLFVFSTMTSHHARNPYTFNKKATRMVLQAAFIHDKVRNGLTQIVFCQHTPQFGRWQ